MDPNSVNYNADANVDDASCVNIAKVQNSLFFKYTATWCGPCGDWGAPAFEEVYDAKKGDILAFTVQVNDDFTTPLNQPILDSFALRWNYSGTPNFVVNNTLLGTSYSGAYTQIDANAAVTPVAGVGLRWSVGGGPNIGKLNIDAYTKFFSATSGTYRMGIYVLYKKVVNPQLVDATEVPDFEHHHVMLGSVNGVWGEKVAEGTITADKISHLGYVFEYDPSWNIAQIEIQAILWKKNATGGWDFVNCTVN